MKRLLSMAVVGAILLSGCGSSNELVDAIDNSYSNSGKIISKYNYNTSYDNLEVGGDIKGAVTTTYGDDVSLIEGNIDFSGTNNEFTYYANDKDDVYSYDGSEVTEEVLAPLYTESPDISDYIDSIPEPTNEEVEVDGVTYNSDVYSFAFDDGLNTGIASSMFDTVIKLGFVSSDLLTNEDVDGKFSLEFYVDSETGNLIKEVSKFSNADNDSDTTKTEITVVTTFDYEEQEVEVPSEVAEVI